jgi:hypothetical protein
MALWGSDDPFIDRIADLQGAAAAAQRRFAQVSLVRCTDFKEVKEGKFSFGEELKAPKLALAKSLDDDENKDEDKCAPCALPCGQLTVLARQVHQEGLAINGLWLPRR